MAPVEIKNTDMSDEMQRSALETALLAMKLYKVDKDIALYIKKEFDRKHQPKWHCIVGKSFGYYVHYNTNCYIFFNADNKNFLLFKYD